MVQNSFVLRKKIIFRARSRSVLSENLQKKAKQLLIHLSVTSKGKRISSFAFTSRTTSKFTVIFSRASFPFKSQTDKL